MKVFVCLLAVIAYASAGVINSGWSSGGWPSSYGSGWSHSSAPVKVIKVVAPSHGGGWNSGWNSGWKPSVSSGWSSGWPSSSSSSGWNAWPSKVSYGWPSSGGWSSGGSGWPSGGSGWSSGGSGWSSGGWPSSGGWSSGGWPSGGSSGWW